MEEIEKFEIHLRRSFEKYYGEDKAYGIYSVTLEENSPNQDKIDSITDFYRDITLVGSMPQLEEGKIYIATVEEASHPQYGKQYKVDTIYKKPFGTREEQVSFLKELITEKQLDSITSAYPVENVVDLFEQDKIDVSLLSGIGDKTYNRIKEKIVENRKYQSAIVQITSQFGVNFSAIKRLSDKYGSPDTLIQKLHENPYIITEIDGFGFKKVDDIALSMGVDKKSVERIKACVQYVLDEFSTKGHCWVRSVKLIADSIKLLKIKISDVQETLKNNTIDGVVENDGRTYLQKFYDFEVGIYKNLIRLLECQMPYKVDNVEQAIKEVEAEQGFAFTDEQIKAINYAVEHNVVVVNGKAGTGKTSVIKGIVGVLKKVEGLEYATCALSGKASQRIQESTGLDSFTIHRILGYNPNLGWGFDEDNHMPYDVIILDEASMVNSQLFFYLTRAIKNGAKLIIAGDTAQLEPIGVGNVLVDILNSDLIPSVELTKVHRQAQLSGILSSANMVRDGLHFLDYKNTARQRLGELKDLYTYPSKDGDAVLKRIEQIANQYKGDILDFQVLVPMKNRGTLSTRNVNYILQEIFNQDPTFVDKRRKFERTIDGKKVTFLEGDKVIINGNNYDKNVFNGTMGIVEFIDTANKDGEIVIDFDGIGRVSFTKHEMKSIDLGYAITIHKSQGSQWKYTVMGIDYGSYVLLNRQSIYTAMTRAIEALFLLFEPKALKHSIDTDNSSERNTFLPELLIAG